MELDKLHVRDNVKLAEVNIKMFLYQDNIPMFEIWLCLSSDVKAKKMLWFFSWVCNKAKNNKIKNNKTKKWLWQSKLMFCYCVTDFFAVCSAIYYSRFMWHFHVFEIFLFGIAVLGFFQTQETSVPCATGCCTHSLEDEDGIEVKRSKI